MIVEMRTYTLAVASTPQYFKLYAEHGMALQTRILGHMVGYYSVEVGGLNQIVHMWAYDSFEERARRRAELNGSAEWQAYFAQVKPLVLKQESQLLNPAPFFSVPPAAA